RWSRPLARPASRRSVLGTRIVGCLGRSRPPGSFTGGWRGRRAARPGSSSPPGTSASSTPPGGAVVSSPAATPVLEALTEQLHGSFFGEPLAWDEALRRFPVGATAQVRDLETGLAFQVRRHRGDAHADVEPLTAEDSETLRTIYGGEWSWKRRAVVATIQDRAVAGSINGMPHGWGDLFDHQFEGHFCPHFAGSRGHTAWPVDGGHQLIVLKAAGLLADTLDQAEPEE